MLMHITVQRPHERYHVHTGDIMTYYVIAFLTFSLGLILRIRAVRKDKAHQAWLKSCLVDRLVELCFIEEHYRSAWEEDQDSCAMSLAYAAEERHELQTEVSLL
jgi:hypothetical protein